MNKGKSLLLSSLVCVAIVAGPAIAFADTSPVCPNVTNYPVNYATANDAASWGAISQTISGNWDNVYVEMYDPDIHSNLNAIVRANEIAKTSGSVDKHKVYLSMDHQGNYFWACDYNIASNYDSIGDSVSVFSPVYGNSNTLSVKRLSSAQKLALYRQQR